MTGFLQGIATFLVLYAIFIFVWAKIDEHRKHKKFQARLDAEYYQRMMQADENGYVAYRMRVSR